MRVKIWLLLLAGWLGVWGALSTFGHGCAIAQTLDPVEPGQYTCPMDPDVVSDTPGRCPKCGMDLVPAERPDPKHQETTPNRSSKPTILPAPEHSHQGHADLPPGDQAKSQIYYCPMHPNYQSDKPGECPICHMTLVRMENAGGSKSAVSGYSVVNLSSDRRQLIGVRTGVVEKKPAFVNIRSAGIVEFNEKTISTVNLKLSGWVDELIVKAEGERVKKGSPLFFLYSPELLEAKKSYLLALDSKRAMSAHPGKDGFSFAEQTLKSTRDRLLLWDMTQEQLGELEKKKDADARTAILSKVNGVVTKRNIVEGSFAEVGTDLYQIADLSTVWVYAEIYASEIPLVKVGQQASIALASAPNEPLTAAVNYVSPYFAKETRTVRVRFELDNTKGKIKPGDYATVSLRVPLGTQLVVDDQAVMDTGDRQIAFADLGDGRLEPREVKVGTRSSGLATITRGLSEGEKVVTSANFLIDSESRIKAALIQGESGAHHH